MNSQNQDIFFTNLFNQDPHLSSTYDGQSGTELMTFDNSPPLPPNNPISVKKQPRGSNFTLEEDKLLVSAWLNCSVDAVQGTDQTYSQLWEKIFVYFQQYKETTTEQTIKSLSQRWGLIQKGTNKFCECLAQIEGLNQSGMTEHDRFEKAKIMHQEVVKCSFQFEHCWYLLKDQPKWISHITKDNTKKRRTIHPSTTPTPTDDSAHIDDSVFNLESGNVNEDGVIELDRPMGRKAEKRKRKAKQDEEKLQLTKMKYTFLNESRAQEKEFYQLMVDKMEYDKKKEDERLRLEAEKMELARKESDQRIMMMDVSVMPEMQRLYFQDLQREIMMRRGLA